VGGRRIPGATVRIPAALKRARDQGLAVYPGQDIEYVVVDDEKTSRERVALAHEELETYGASYYETHLIRAVDSVLSPLDWDRRRFVVNLERHGCRSLRHSRTGGKINQQTGRSE
jgi:DNA polymerase elongation subunit (family B)